jgi:CDP-paratose 2-epimerase
LKQKTVLITGSSGLVGSEAVLFYSKKGYKTVGIDNNMRADFFGTQADTSNTLNYLNNVVKDFEYHNTDIRAREEISSLIKKIKPNIIIHCAAQPSHDLATTRPFDDFDVNAVGTLNLLEACRNTNPESPFIFVSTNKVYGDAPNEFEFEELETRYEFKNKNDYFGINESLRIDQSMHSLFGASKLAADILTQEYGKYYGMPTVCFRAGCITGKRHQAVELHGFFSYLAKVVATEKNYKIFGFKGKQVRDQIHSFDLINAMDFYAESPSSCGEVFNIGGGRESNSSVLESIKILENLFKKEINIEYVDLARKGDHQCYITDLRKFKKAYPKWKITFTINEIVEEFFKFYSGE